MLEIKNNIKENDILLYKIDENILNELYKCQYIIQNEYFEDNYHKEHLYQSQSRLFNEINNSEVINISINKRKNNCKIKRFLSNYFNWGNKLFLVKIKSNDKIEERYYYKEKLIGKRKNKSYLKLNLKLTKTLLNEEIRV